ncbi:MAG: hypothetical protein HQ523_14645 [Lentisphaerae bacterium]|nr:hypothetical protein [Lentisphaerota bacterium]
MVKRVVMAIIAVFIAWSVLDVVIHGVILKTTYGETASLWRPEGEMKMGLMYAVGAVGAAAFVGLYAAVAKPKSIAAGLKYGLLFGIATGFPMGFGTYCVMPVPVYLAVVWFLGSLVETLVGGAIVGAMIKPSVSSDA